MRGDKVLWRQAFFIGSDAPGIRPYEPRERRNSSFKKASQKQRQRKNIHNQLIGTVIPSLKSEIRRRFSEHFNEQVNLLINEQTTIFDSQIKAKQSEIVEAERVKKEAVQDIEQTISKLIHIRDNIRSLADQVIFTQ